MSERAREHLFRFLRDATPTPHRWFVVTGGGINEYSHHSFAWYIAGPSKKVTQTEWEQFLDVCGFIKPWKGQKVLKKRQFDDWIVSLPVALQASETKSVPGINNNSTKYLLCMGLPTLIHQEQFNRQES